MTGAPDARRRRRDRDGGAHRRAGERRRRRRRDRWRSSPGEHVRRAGGDLEAGDVVFEPGTVLGPAHASACSRRVDARRVRAVSRVRASACCRPATSSSSRGRSRRARSATPTGRCCSRSSPVPAPTPVDLGCGARRRGVDDRDARATRSSACDAVITSGGVSVGDFDYVSDALERIAADDPSRRFARRLVPGGDQAREAAVLRDGAGHARVRASRQPGVVVRQLRAVRAAGAAAQMMGHTAARSAARSRAAAARRDAPSKSTASSISTGSSSTSVDGRYVATAVRSQESNALAATAAANGARAAARRRGRRRRRRRHRHVARLTCPRRLASAHSVPTGETGGARSRLTLGPTRPKVRENGRPGCPGRSSPSPPQDGSRCPHVRATRRTGRFSPSARCSPRGCRVARQREPSPRSSDEVCTSPCVTMPLEHSTTAVPDGLVCRRRGRREAAAREHRARRRRAPRSRPGFANVDHGSCCSMPAIWAFPLRKQTTGPPIR